MCHGSLFATHGPAFASIARWPTYRAPRTVQCLARYGAGRVVHLSLLARSRRTASGAWCLARGIAYGARRDNTKYKNNT
eukprot:9921472-Lingulodinium_polyedra.AAC.1